MKSLFKRSIAVMLTVVMAITSFTITSFADGGEEPVAPTAPTLKATTATIAVGEKVQIELNDATGYTAGYVSNATATATVDATGGLVTGVAAGETKITVTLAPAEGANVVLEFTVTVTAAGGNNNGEEQGSDAKLELWAHYQGDSAAYKQAAGTVVWANGGKATLENSAVYDSKIAQFTAFLVEGKKYYNVTDSKLAIWNVTRSKTDSLYDASKAKFEADKSEDGSKAADYAKVSKGKVSPGKVATAVDNPVYVWFALKGGKNEDLPYSPVSTPVTVKVAPKALKLDKGTTDAPKSKLEVGVDASAKVYLTPFAETDGVSTADLTFTASYNKVSVEEVKDGDVVTTKGVIGDDAYVKLTQTSYSYAELIAGINVEAIACKEDAKGKKSAASAKINISCDQNGKKMAVTIKVTPPAADEEEETPAASKIKSVAVAAKAGETAKQGGTMEFEATVTLTDANDTTTDKTVTWTIASEKTAGSEVTISDAGKVTIPADYVGTFTVTATSTVDTKVKGSATPVEVEEAAAPAAKTLASIAVTTQPTKTAYTVGDSFDATDMVVTATYDDTSTAAVTGYTVDKTAALTASDTTVTITYEEGGVSKTTTVTITVADA